MQQERSEVNFQKIRKKIKRIIAWDFNYFLLIVLSLLISLFYTSSIYKNFSTLESNYFHNVLKGSKDNKLLAGNVIQGEFQSKEDNLGIVAIRFNTYDRINTDLITFKIKEKGHSTWYYENEYNTKEFGGYTNFPFGFPIISNSKDKIYSFELKSLRGTRNNSVSVSGAEPVVVIRYKYSVIGMIKNPKQLLSFLLKKFLYSINSTTFALFFLVTNVFLIFIYKEYVVLITKNDSHISLPKKTHRFKKNFKEYTFLVHNKYFWIIIVIGLFLRISLALNKSSNFDMQNFIIDSKIFQEGKRNIYLYQPSYNYSIAFFYIVGIIGTIQKYLLPFLSFEFVFRSFISFVDVGTAIVLYKLSKLLKIPPLKTTALFFINPVSIILSGYHAQFDNIAVFFLLCAILYFYTPTTNGKFKNLVTWIILTVGFIIKHIIIFPVLLFLLQIHKKNQWKALLFFCFSVFLFFITFLPFISSAFKDISENVFNYQGLATLSGVTYILNDICSTCNLVGIKLYFLYRQIFIITAFLFVFFIRKYDSIRYLLLSLLFFLSFTSAHAAQYFVLPIALGALFPTRWFLLYTFVTCLFLLGNEAELNIHVFNFVTFNIVWIFALTWFFSELLVLVKPVKNVYNYLANKLNYCYSLVESEIH